MSNRENCWAVLLAAGDGRRLTSLTTTRKGVAVPKQFCALHRGPSLLQQALQRAVDVATWRRVCAVVAADHRNWWSEQLGSVRADNLVVQPKNRGTANGILLPLLTILDRDPDARIVLLPSDHHVLYEDTLAESICTAASRSEAKWPEIVLLGLNPREPDSELGYILPGRDQGAGYLEVERFVEKPSTPQARELIAQGALWNAFIIAADAQALLKLYERRSPDIVSAMSEIISAPSSEASREERLAELYEVLPGLDFSKDILQGHEGHLRVLPVPECGWSDLGTPQRVGQVLRELKQNALPPVGLPIKRQATYLSLAAQHERFCGSIRA